MLKMEFSGTVKEVMDEIKEFVGMPTEVKTTKESVAEETKELPALPTTSVKEETAKEQKVPTVLPTMPTVATEYKLEDLQTMASDLMLKAPGNREALQKLLNDKYSAKSLLDLTSDAYGAFVQDLKNLGADV